MKKAVIFNRASRDTSGRGKSVKDQDRDNHATASHNDWEVAAVFTENNIGASKHSKKPRLEYKKMLAYLQEHDDTYVLICWEGSRNDRTLQGFVELSGLLQDTDTKLCIGGRVLDLNDDGDEFTAGLDALLNVREIARLRKRVLRGQKANALAGKPHSKPAYGYKSVGTGVWDFGPAFKTVKYMYEWIYKGKSGTSLAKDLNQKMVPTPTWRIPFVWKEWSYAQVRQILINPVYIGKRIYRSEVIGEGTWPVGIDEEIYWSVYNKLTDPTRKTSRDGGVVHLCGGKDVVSCDNCNGGRLRFHNIRKEPYYVCADKECTSIRYETLNELVRNRVLVRLSDPAWWSLIVSQARDRSEDASKVRSELARLKSELNDAHDLRKSGGLTVKSFALIEQDLQPQIDALELKRDSGIHPLLLEANESPSAEEVWERWNIEQKREVVRSLYSIRLLTKAAGRREPHQRVVFKPL